MKRFPLLAGMIVTVIILGIFLISTGERDTEITRGVTKVGLILNGSKEDDNWGESHYKGMTYCQDQLNLQVICMESVPEGDECLSTIESLIQEGCKIIICNSFGFGESVSQMAKKYPDIYFFHATGTEQSDNLVTYFGRMYQMRYLSGIVAGMQTQTDKIGYVAAFPIDEVNRGINAFTLGVRAVNKNAEVYVQWSGSWTDEVLNKEATETLLQAHDIDVIAMHTDSNEPLKVAEEQKIWSIGYNIDNSELYPGSYLTAPVWQWEYFYEPHIRACLQDKFVGKHYWLGAESELISLAPFTSNVKPGIAAVVEEELLKLQSGNYDVFYGPVEDNTGKIRIPEKESMSDYSMLNEFDWYVKGVVLSEE